ncbi:MAG: ferredoxin reductase family protein [Alphaproteobacteria bacterium]
MTGFAILLVEFVLSGRFRMISGRMGIDATMRFHQLVARPLTLLLLIHPFLYATPYGPSLPWDVSRQLTLGLDGWALVSGLAAWILLAVVVVAAIFRDQLPYRYEAWRVSHGIGAALIALFGAHHALEAGRYSAHPAFIVFWLAMVGLALLTLAMVYVVRPLLQLRHPYRVTSNRPIAIKTWELVLEPMRGRALAFDAGQFVWLTLDRPPFSIREHPFSICSAPCETGRLAFAIKQVGDFTNRIGEIAIGAPAYLDGPHGGLVLTGQVGRGIVFIAGGVGVAPILSMLRQLSVAGDERPMKLLYGNRVQEQVIYADELRAMSDALDLEVVHVLSEPPGGWTGEIGQLDSAFVQRHCRRGEQGEWFYVICGPTPMIDSIEDALTAIGVPTRQIISEKFSYF